MSGQRPLLMSIASDMRAEGGATIQDVGDVWMSKSHSCNASASVYVYFNIHCVACVAVYYSVLWCVVVYYRVLQGVAGCCSVMQCVVV